MTDDKFIDSVIYFWRERDIERMAGFSVGRLREIDPALAKAYEDYVVAEDIFDRLIKAKWEATT